MQKSLADKLAKALETYWRDRGYDLTAYAILESEVLKGRDGSRFAWTVRTVPPLVNGFPTVAPTQPSKLDTLND